MSRQQWIEQERKLWDAMTRAKTRPLTNHSVSKSNRGAHKEHVRLKELQRKKEFERGWVAFQAWIKH